VSLVDFSPYDPVIERWSRRRRIPLFTSYRDDEVRAFEIVTPLGERRQIWIEVNGDVVVHVWDFQKRRRTFTADAQTLEGRLDDALELARAWK
jgi:hypothetical protein